MSPIGTALLVLVALMAIVSGSLLLLCFGALLLDKARDWWADRDRRRHVAACEITERLKSGAALAEAFFLQEDEIRALPEYPLRKSYRRTVQ